MARAADLMQLRRIAVIREVQAASALALAARAASDAAQSRDTLNDRARACRAAEDSWQAALSTPRLAVETLPFWSAALVRSEDGLRAALRDVETTEAARMECTQAFHAASKRREIAQATLRAARKARAARRDETAMQHASDQFPHRRESA
ncbi:MAG: hypothetical protein WDM91_23625 [Rhizomicrobium sp.]